MKKIFLIIIGLLLSNFSYAENLSKESKNDVFVFNGWMFSSSPSITPFDHPIYDVWLIKCY